METFGKKISIYKNIHDIKSPHTISVWGALERIKNGKSKVSIEEIRSKSDKEIQDALKKNLPCITFSGVFDERYDDMLTEHSSFICLDFDLKSPEEAIEKKQILMTDPFVWACWISPRGQGVKALYRVINGMLHREHFNAIKQKYPSIDGSGANPSRVCYESYDPEIYINPNAKWWEKTHDPSVIKKYEIINSDSMGDNDKYEKLKKWLVGRGDTFATGSRNHYIYKLASACCRFGIDETTASAYITTDYVEKDFPPTEVNKTIESAYKRNRNQFGTANFSSDNTIREKNTDYVINPQILEDGYKLPDVIYGGDVSEDADGIYDSGYALAETCYVEKLDEIYKWKKGQINCFTGIGNMGKSTIKEYLMILKALRDGTKFAIFSPENFPAGEWFFNMTEMLMGCDLTPQNYKRPSREKYKEAYDFISKHFFYVYPENISSTPLYIKQKFLELVIKENAKGVLIDPFNQLEHDHTKFGGRDDKYLDTALLDFGRFAKENSIYFDIIAHPKSMQKAGDGNYPCPDVFDISGGAMWNNKIDNIFVYHRPYSVTDPRNSFCEFHSKKVKKQKLFLKGHIDFNYLYHRRRFVFDGIDPLNDQNPFNHWNGEEAPI